MVHYSDFNLPATTKSIPCTNDFAYSFRPIYLYSRALGLMPFSIIRASNGEVQKAQVKVFDVLWFVTTICLYLFLSYCYAKSTQIAIDTNESYFLSLNDDIGIIFSFIFGAITIGIDMFNRSRLTGILKDFSLFDKKVNRINIIQRNDNVIIFCI